MSYILDALKRADTERERGAAPGLHTRHQLPAGDTGTPSERRSVGLAAAAGLTLVVLATFFWLWRTPDAPPRVPLKPAVNPMPTAVAPAAPVVPAAPVAPNTQPAAIMSTAPIPIVAAQATIAKAKPTDKTSPKTGTATPVSTTASAPTAAPAAALLSELPAELRSQVPKITITGSVYSDSPAQRLLLVNNQVLVQGSQVTPELRLEEIQPRSSVFSFKGSRFRVMH